MVLVTSLVVVDSNMVMSAVQGPMFRGNPKTCNAVLSRDCTVNNCKPLTFKTSNFSRETTIYSD